VVKPATNTEERPGGVGDGRLLTMLSQTSAYALRAMVCLAQRPDVLTPTPMLARLTGVPHNYLAKVLQMLAAADLVAGRRGVGGGYSISRDREEVSLSDVISAVESQRLSRYGPPEDAPGLGALYDRLDEAGRSATRILESTTLSDLLVKPGQPDALHLAS